MTTSELTAMQQAVLLLLREYKNKEGAFTVTAERLESEIIGDYPIMGESAPQTAGECAIGASDDTREKLEADALDFIGELAIFLRTEIEGGDVVVKDQGYRRWANANIIALLDRQEAITEREQEGVIAVLQAEANALEAENDELAHERSDVEMERDELLQKAQRFESDLRAMTAERDHWRDEVASLRQVLDALTRQLADYQDARDEGVA